ncbi:MDN1, partial [Symbiodinium pilosum]
MPPKPGSPRKPKRRLLAKTSEAEAAHSPKKAKPGLTNKKLEKLAKQTQAAAASKAKGQEPVVCRTPPPVLKNGGKASSETSGSKRGQGKVTFKSEPEVHPVTVTPPRKTRKATEDASPGMSLSKAEEILGEMEEEKAEADTSSASAGTEEDEAGGEESSAEDSSTEEEGDEEGKQGGSNEEKDEGTEPSASASEDESEDEGSQAEDEQAEEEAESEDASDEDDGSSQDSVSGGTEDDNEAEEEDEPTPEQDKEKEKSKEEDKGKQNQNQDKKDKQKEKRKEKENDKQNQNQDEKDKQKEKRKEKDKDKQNQNQDEKDKQKGKRKEKENDKQKQNQDEKDKQREISKEKDKGKHNRNQDEKDKQKEKRKEKENDKQNQQTPDPDSTQEKQQAREAGKRMKQDQRAKSEADATSLALVPADKPSKRKAHEVEAGSETGSKRNNKKEKKAKKIKDEAKEPEDEKKLAQAEEGLPKAVNSNSHHKLYLRYGRWVKNKKRFPEALSSRLQTEEGRMKLFADYVEAGGDPQQVVLKHTQQLREAQRTITDPESPEDKLYFMFIEINIDDVRELERITKLELNGSIDAECLAAFTKEGGVLDPSKQQLAQSGGASAQGMAKALQLTGTVAPSKSKGKAGKTAKGGEAGAAKEVTPDTPLQKAAALVNTVLREKNTCSLCRDLAFKLKPIKMSDALIQQLLALEKKFSQKASELQKLVAANKNKNKYYKYIIDEVEKLKETAKERTDIAKALIRASQKAKNPDKDKNKEAATQKDDSKVEMLWTMQVVLLGEFFARFALKLPATAGVAQARDLVADKCACSLAATLAEFSTGHEEREIVGWVQGVLQSGRFPATDFNGDPWPEGSAEAGRANELIAAGYMFAFSGFKGDWEARVVVHKLQRSYNHNNICEHCPATKLDTAFNYRNFALDAPYLDVRFTHAQFMMMTPPQLQSSWQTVPGWTKDRNLEAETAGGINLVCVSYALAKMQFDFDMSG